MDTGENENDLHCMNCNRILTEDERCDAPHEDELVCSACGTLNVEADVLLAQSLIALWH